MAENDNEIDQDALDSYAFDTAAWTQYLKSATPEDTPCRFRTFLTRFPTSSKHWIAYISHILQHQRDYALAQKLFEKCLKPVNSVDLWKLYLDYVRSLNDASNKTTTEQEKRATIVQAYEFVLSHCGVEYYASPIWIAYLDFLSSFSSPDPSEESQRIDHLRKTFHRALLIPSQCIEQICKKYDGIENTVGVSGGNKLMAKKYLSERSGMYMNARVKAKELRALLDPINRSALASPPSFTILSQPPIEQVEKDLKQLEYARKWVQWEMANPLNFIDQHSVQIRVGYAYQQLLLHLYHYPALWTSYLGYLFKSNQSDALLAQLPFARKACPNSLLVGLYVSECYENAKMEEECKKTYEEMIEAFEERIRANKDRCEQTRVLVQQMENQLSRQQQQQTTNGTDYQEHQKQEGKSNTAGESAAVVDTGELSTLRSEYALKSHIISTSQNALNLTYIAYMKSQRRLSGAHAARLIFSRSRKSEFAGPVLFLAAARMEKYWNKDSTVAGKIFEVGLKMFGNVNVSGGESDSGNVEFVCAYLEYLLSSGEDANARALFERTVGTSIAPTSNTNTNASSTAAHIANAGRLRRVWDIYMAYEWEYGDLATIHTLEKRYRELYPDGPTSHGPVGAEEVMLAKKYTYLSESEKVVYQSELGMDSILISLSTSLAGLGSPTMGSLEEGAALFSGDLGKRLSVVLGLGLGGELSRRGSTMNGLGRSDSNLYLNRAGGVDHGAGDAGVAGGNGGQGDQGTGVGVKLASSREEEVIVSFVRNPLTTHQVHVLNTNVKLIRPDFTNTVAGDGPGGYKPMQPETRPPVQSTSRPMGGGHATAPGTPSADPIADLLHRIPPAHAYHSARGPLLNPDQILDLVVQHAPQHAPGAGYLLAPPYPINIPPSMAMSMPVGMGMSGPMPMGGMHAMGYGPSGGHVPYGGEKRGSTVSSHSEHDYASGRRDHRDHGHRDTKRRRN